MDSVSDDNAILERHKEISVWLESIFYGKPVPQFEINKETIDMLYDVMKKNKELDRLTSICIDDVTRKTQEYAIEASSCKQTLDDIGLQYAALSHSGLSSLKTLSDLAVALELKNCNHSSYIMAMSDLSCKMEETRSALKKKQNENIVLQNVIKETFEEKKSLQGNFELLEQRAVIQHPLKEKRTKETQFLKEKTKEYNQLIENLQEATRQAGYTQDLNHENLEQLGEELNEIRGQINALKGKLSSYHSLPPDMSLARVKIEEAKQELRRLEEELYIDLEVLNL